MLFKYLLLSVLKYLFAEPHYIAKENSLLKPSPNGKPLVQQTW